jgi:inorganic triphosphatase YgiF
VSNDPLVHRLTGLPALLAGSNPWRRAQTSLEIEAKFRVDDRRIFDQLLALASLGDARLTAQPEPELQHTTYYDTPTETLRARKFSLRVREVAGRRIATVKRSRGGASGLHVREEWETPIGPEVHPGSWPPGLARERALALLGCEPLLPLCSVHTLRHTITVQRDGRLVAELCLDEGHVRAGGRAASFRELEVELQGLGTMSDLRQLCAWLSARFPLTPELTGKRSRGLALRALVAAEP